MRESPCSSLCFPSDNKILFLVIDGLGGLPRPETGKTELETAHTPNLDRLALEGVVGRATVVSHGITPGSGPGHLSIFGYDPRDHPIGRGVLEALGVGFELQPGDLAARGNFCTLGPDGAVEDRRAGIPTSERSHQVCERLNREVKLPGVRSFVLPGKQHRFSLVLRGEGLVVGADDLSETDPQRAGLKPLPVRALRSEAQLAADLLNRWLSEAREVLSDEGPINFALLRGIGNPPTIQSFPERYCAKAVAAASYPMYRGIGRLLGMDVLEVGNTLDDQISALTKAYSGYDYFYFHVKETDSAGHAGDFDKKVKLLEQVDQIVPMLRAIGFHTIVVTGDHCTPTLLKEHSFHPVPVLLWSPVCLTDTAASFGERECMQGGLGLFPLWELMPLALGHALRLNKFGA